MSAEARPRCFVISPIGEEGSDDRQHADMVLNAIIRPALPEFDVFRADEFGAPDMISDKMIDAIFSYELAIADLSFRNPNVFYEIGLRHMTELPLIHIAQKGTALPFDTAGMKTLSFDIRDWHSQVRVRDAISSAAKIAVAKDYKVSNPVTQARGAINLAKSADSNERLLSETRQAIAELQAEHTVLKSAVRRLSTISGRSFFGGDRNIPINDAHDALLDASAAANTYVTKMTD